MRRAFRAGIALAMLGSAMTPAQSGDFARPPFAGAYEPQGTDERGLWMEMDEAERGFRDSPSVLHDQALTAYIHGVLCRAVGTDRCGAARIYILLDDSFNASMAPNGLLIVHTGLLARAHSEAELAAVLGHEFAHFERRHSLNGFKAGRATRDVLAWLSLAGAVARVRTANAANSLVFGYFRFQRDQESEADALSVEFLRGSPYRLRGAEMWQRVVDEEDALRRERGLRKIRRATPGLLDTHPAMLERIAFNAKKAADLGPVGEDGADSYRAATVPVLRALFDPLIKGNDFAGADYVIRSRGDALGWDGALYYLRGELYRLRGNPRDLVTARDFFQQAVDRDGSPAESWRGLGLCAMRMGDAETGRSALVHYLKDNPGAGDAASIKLLVEN